MTMIQMHLPRATHAQAAPRRRCGTRAPLNEDAPALSLSDGLQAPAPPPAPAPKPANASTNATAPAPAPAPAAIAAPPGTTVSYIPAGGASGGFGGLAGLTITTSNNNDNNNNAIGRGRE